MLKTHELWREKLEKEQGPKVVDVPLKIVKGFRIGKVFVPTPLLVDALICKVQKGKPVTVNQIREHLAEDLAELNLDGRSTQRAGFKGIFKERGMKDDC